MYNFLNITFPKGIYDWIEENTKSDGSRDKCNSTDLDWESNFDEYGNLVLRDETESNSDPSDSNGANADSSTPQGFSEEDLEDLFNPMQKCLYSTSRDSKKAVSRWAEKLTLEEVNIMEKNRDCDVVFEQFGYKKIGGLGSFNALNLTDILALTF